MTKRSGEKAPHVKKVRWYRLQKFWDEPGEKVAEIEGHDVIVQGHLYEGELKCECGRIHLIDGLKVRGDPRVILEGENDGATVTLQPSLSACVVPPEAISNLQGKKLELMLNANLRTPTMIFTNNIQLVQLKEISESAAKKIMMADAAKLEEKHKAEEGGNIVSIEKARS